MFNICDFSKISEIQTFFKKSQTGYPGVELHVESKYGREKKFQPKFHGEKCEKWRILGVCGMCEKNAKISKFCRRALLSYWHG